MKVHFNLGAIAVLTIINPQSKGKLKVKTAEVYFRKDNLNLLRFLRDLAPFVK
jgi:hypothetical protein